MAKKKIERFCIFRNLRTNMLHYVYDYYELIHFQRAGFWAIIKQAECMEDCLEVFKFEDYALIGEFRGYRIR